MPEEAELGEESEEDDEVDGTMLISVLDISDVSYTGEEVETSGTGPCKYPFYLRTTFSIRTEVH